MKKLIIIVGSIFMVIGFLTLISYFVKLWADSTHDERYLTKTVNELTYCQVGTAYNVDPHWAEFFRVMDTLKNGQTIKIGKKKFIVSFDSSSKNYYNYWFEAETYSLKAHIGEFNKYKEPYGAIKYVVFCKFWTPQQDKYHGKNKVYQDK